MQPPYQPPQQPYPQPPYQQQPYQPPQQPYYPPMPPQRPHKSRRGLWITFGVVGLILFAFIGIGSLGSHSSTTSTSPASVNTAPATQQNSTNAIGKPVVVNGDWTITLNSTKTSHGTQFNPPKAGNILLVVNVTLRNTSSSNQTASSLLMFSLKDSTGQTHNQDITYGTSPDGPVAKGGVIRGNIAYEVPQTAHSFTLQFVPGLTSSDLAEWTVTL